MRFLILSVCLAFVMMSTLVAGRTTGQVKSYNKSMGSGYITPDDKSADVLVLSKDIDSILRFLTSGQPVEFDIIEEKDGRKASNVVSRVPPIAY